MLEVVTLVVGSFMTCCYLVFRKGTTAAMVVDPGSEGQTILAEIEKRGLDVVTIFNTHGHSDHISANDVIKKAFPEAQIIIGARDAAMLTSPLRNLSILFLKHVKSPRADRVVNEGDVVQVDSAAGRVLDTPGHTTGGISLYFSAEENGGVPIVFSGDALFRMGVGRADFPGGDMQQLIGAIREKLLTLPGETIVYPGHGEATTVRDEALSNPFLING